MLILDMDGVLVDSQLHWLREFGVDIGYEDWPEHIGWDITAAYNHFSGDDWSDDDFWHSVKEHHWAESPKSEICDYLIEFGAKRFGKKNVFICTSPTRHHSCFSGKWKWIQANLPSWIHRNVFIGSRKEMLAAPGRLLVDDADHNIDQFVDNGGLGLMVPRPWNRLADQSGETKQFVTTMLEYFSK